MTLVNARAAFETAIKTAVTAADNTVTVVFDNMPFTTPGKNKKYVMVNIKEIYKNVPVRIKFGTQKNMLLKFIYVQMDAVGDEIKYKMVKPPKG